MGDFDEKPSPARGEAKWLPDAEWLPSKMKVFRIEAALRARGTGGAEAPRIFLDRYVVVFTQNAIVCGELSEIPANVVRAYRLPSKRSAPFTRPGGYVPGTASTTTFRLASLSRSQTRGAPTARE